MKFEIRELLEKNKCRESIRDILKKIDEDSKDDYMKTRLYEELAKECYTQMVEMQESLEYYSDNDIFTGLANRNSFICDCKKYSNIDYNSVGVAFIDINGLKYINNRFGIQEGDNTIKFTVKLLEKYFKEDKIYRISGDEFVVMSFNIKSNVFFEKMEKLEEELTILNTYIASCGYIWEDRNIPLMHAVEKADNLMRIEKENFYKEGKRPERYSPVGFAKIMKDLEKEKFLVYYQPKINLKTEEIYGAEALVRMKDDEGNIISPDHFIPDMEKSLTIGFLDYYVFEKVCEKISEWKSRNIRNIHISTNFSRVTISERKFIKNIENIRKKYNVESSQLSIELTESVETYSEISLTETLLKLKNMGYGIELDDYGKDYSSIEMLKFDSIDTIKVDRSLIKDIDTVPKHSLILNHLCDLCHDIGMKCLIEGIETKFEFNVLKKMGYDYAQGYFIGKPVSVSDFEELYLI